MSFAHASFREFSPCILHISCFLLRQFHVSHLSRILSAQETKISDPRFAMLHCRLGDSVAVPRQSWTESKLEQKSSALPIHPYSLGVRGPHQFANLAILRWPGRTGVINEIKQPSAIFANQRGDLSTERLAFLALKLLKFQKFICNQAYPVYRIIKTGIVRISNEAINQDK